jgi:membrane-associated phospholipid phosphatase
MSILAVNDLALQLVARDFSNGHSPSNAGPTRTSRALAIIHLAARDAYAIITQAFPAKLAGLPIPPTGLGNDDATGTAGLVGAALRSAERLYPDDVPFIETELASLVASANSAALAYGAIVADSWLANRSNDRADLPHFDALYDARPGHHRPDPVNPGQKALGRLWGQVTPFALADVVTDAPLAPPPDLDSVDYALAFDDVFVNGRDDVTKRDDSFQQHALVGIFWGYDGANLLGTPPRLYNQVLRATADFAALPHPSQVNVLAAVNAAMADAGIAAWHWKYAYDLWRPVIGIREATKTFGPTGEGDKNPHRTNAGDAFWLPLGAPRSNPYPAPTAGAPGSNFTPNFPAYPSGHASFGTAAFRTFAGLIGKTVDQIAVEFVSDEFDGKTTDHLGVLRPRWKQLFTLEEAIAQNSVSRIYLGVHWRFDATGGEAVGEAVAKKVVAAFQ